MHPTRLAPKSEWGQGLEHKGLWAKGASRGLIDRQSAHASHPHGSRDCLGRTRKMPTELASPGSYPRALMGATAPLPRATLSPHK